MLEIVNHIQVNLLGSYGSDIDIVNHALLTTGKESKNVQKTIEFLLKNKHMKPFEIGMLHFEVEIPIFLDRQLCTYRTLIGSLAQSGRYGSTTTKFYLPPELNTMEIKNHLLTVVNIYKAIGTNTQRQRELARCILPQNQVIKRRFQINLRNFIHFINERLNPIAQLEMRLLAKEMFDLTREKFPIIINTLYNMEEVNENK